MSERGTRRALLTFWVALWLVAAGGVAVAKVTRERARGSAIASTASRQLAQARDVREHVTWIAGWTWLAMTCVSGALSTTRLGAWVARGSLTMAAAFFAAACAHAAYASLAFAQHGLFLGLVMLAVSGAFVVIERATERMRHEDARSDRICQTCGYDVRYSPERCPECGTPVTASPAGTTTPVPRA
jgi:hypothetical protein